MVSVTTIEEAARRLGVSTKTVQRYLQSGKLSGQKVDGRWTIRLPSVEEEPELQQATDNLDGKAELDTIRAERDWLRHLVEEITATNRELTLVNRELVAALQSSRSKGHAETRRQRLQIMPADVVRDRRNAFSDSNGNGSPRLRATESRHILRKDRAAEASIPSGAIDSEIKKVHRANDQAVSASTTSYSIEDTTKNEKSA
jgi:excisionase family DNA binding protein